MSRWRQTFTENLVPLAELTDRFATGLTAVEAVAKQYPFRITRHYFNLIIAKNDPIWRQAVPEITELSDDCQQPDPLNENGLSPVPGLIHRYPDRVVWLVSNECAVYCRFCMRKRRVGCNGGDGIHAAGSEAIRYIAANPAIRDVILSGGDPLLLEDEQLAELLAALRAIPHVEIIRIGTRVPVTFPERITRKLASLFRQHQPLYINTHFNHPIEINTASRNACAIIADAGIPLGNQTVLLKGVNDDPLVMRNLNRGLLQMRVKPYYLHQMDLVKGTAHFRTSVRTGLEIMESLRGHLSGLAVPYYVIDLPEGKGKVPLLPGQQIPADGIYKLRTYRGEIHKYIDIERS
jgi:lysine 2,3-aminomutase